MARIAIVGHEWLPRALLRAELREAGHEVEGFESIGDVIVPLQIGLLPVDLLVVDTARSDVNANRLRELRAAARRTPVRILSGHYDSAGLDFAALGFPNVILRPVLIRSLLESIERLIEADSRAEGKKGVR